MRLDFLGLLLYILKGNDPVIDIFKYSIRIWCACALEVFLKISL